MPAIKLLNLFALSTFAILLCTLAPSQTLALAVQPNHLARQLPNHHGIAKKKRGTKRCKSRSSSLPLSSTPAPKPTSTPPKDNTIESTSSPKNNPSLSSTSSPPNPTKTPTGSGKLGIAWALGDDKRLDDITKYGRAVIIHLWDSTVSDLVKNSGIPVSIMLWNNAQDKIDRFVKNAKPGYAKYAYGFNEVNEPSQANMDVSTAVSVYKQYIQPLGQQGYTLGGPCTTSAPNGFDWMTQFFKQCGSDDCGVVEVPIHWYDVKFEDFKTYINKWAGFGKPMRVTEFACQNFNGGAQPSMDEVWSFSQDAINYLEGDGRILSYAPFGFMDDLQNVNGNDALFTKGGLTSLGMLYAAGHA